MGERGERGQRDRERGRDREERDRERERERCEIMNTTASLRSWGLTKQIKVKFYHYKKSLREEK